MPSTFTRGSTVLTPLLVTGWRSTRPQASVVHDVIGADPVVTARTAGTRSGSITMLWPTPAAADTAETALCAAGPAWVIDATSDVPGLAMTAQVLTTDLTVTSTRACELTITVREVAS